MPAVQTALLSEPTLLRILIQEPYLVETLLREPHLLEMFVDQPELFIALVHQIDSILQASGGQPEQEIDSTEAGLFDDFGELA